MDKRISALLKDNLLKVLDVLNDGIIITDKKGIVCYINPAYSMFSGLNYDEIVGRYLPDVREGAVTPKVLRTLKPMINMPRKVDGVESYCDVFPIIIDGVLIGGLVVVKDVVQIKGILKQLEESKEKITQLDERIKETFRTNYTFKDVVGAQEGLKRTIDMAYKAACADCPILLVGESGTGKEVIAGSIHNDSSRSEKPFVAINCAALPEHLLESELFGYEGGAFTGAKKTGKLGLFEIANGGTIFLDEVTEIPLNLQSKLLRAIQEKRILRVGGENYINLDVRIIAATNKNIVDMVNEGKFRDDLYFRLAVFVINIPPLRDRKSDILLLADKFIDEQMKKRKHVISISPEAMNVLINYKWPGNIREIKNAIEYACNVTDDYVIKVEDLPQTLLKVVKFNSILEKDRKGISLESIVSEVEKNVIADYLNLYGDSIDAKKKISEELNISIATLYNKIKKYNL